MLATMARQHRLFTRLAGSAEDGLTSFATILQ